MDQDLTPHLSYKGHPGVKKPRGRSETEMGAGCRERIAVLRSAECRRRRASERGLEGHLKGDQIL